MANAGHAGSHPVYVLLIVNEKSLGAEWNAKCLYCITSADNV